MKIKVREILLSWRKERGSRRKVVGVLKRTATTGITFRYLKKGALEAKEEGFKEYPGFPLDFNKIYQENDLDIFSLRLIPFDRKDNLKLIEFWEAQGVTDKFDLLALTQGMLPTDNFEFLGNFNPQKNFRFVTDLAGLSHIKLENGSVKIGDKLTYIFKENRKSLKGRAVIVFKGEMKVGFIKIVHDNIFLNSKNKRLSLTVKEVEQNGMIKNIFVLVIGLF